MFKYHQDLIVQASIAIFEHGNDFVGTVTNIQRVALFNTDTYVRISSNKQRYLFLV